MSENNKKRRALTGAGKVFAFTFVQTMKTPSMLIATICLFAVALFALPVMSLTSGSDEEKMSDTTSIARLVIVDETGLELSSWLDITAMEYEGALPETIEFSEESYDDLISELEEESEEDWALIDISYDEEEYVFGVTGVYGTGTGADSYDLTNLTDLIGENLQSQMMTALNISEEQIAYINHEVVEDVTYFGVNEDGKLSEIADEIDEDEEGSVSMLEYTLILIILCVTILLISMNGEQVATSVVQEKSSKVVEYLLISVRPFSLMVGKVLAMFTVTLLQLLLMGVGMYMSSILYVFMHPGSILSATDMLVEFLSDTDEMGTVAFNGGAIPIAILLILAGALFYSTIAALVGACVSRIEDLTESMKTFSLIMIVGAYLGLAVVIADLFGSTPEALKIAAELLPLSSPFITPAYLLLEKMPLWLGAVALVIFVVALIGLFMFSANVYETLIYHNGDKIKVKDLIRLGGRNNTKEGSVA